MTILRVLDNALRESTKNHFRGKSRVQELKILHVEHNKIEALTQKVSENLHNFFDRILSRSNFRRDCKSYLCSGNEE